MGRSKRYFTSQSFINLSFYSAIACLHPFLNSHLAELGLSWAQCAWINSVSALVSMVGPLCLGPIAHKLSGYKQTLVLALLLAFGASTGLLFVPSVISSEHTPKMYFDCTEDVFRIEQCPNWEGQCHTYPKRPATNFSSFELVTCSYVCSDDRTAVNSTLYPINVCFNNNDNNNNDPSNLCLDVPKERIIPTDASLSQEASIQFDSRFDRWPVLESPVTGNQLVDRMFDGLRTCTYKPAAPLLISQNVFASIQCRPTVPNCNIYCSVSLRHRTSGFGSGGGGSGGTSAGGGGSGGSGSNGGSRSLRPPTPCHLEKGNRTRTLYLYLLLRCLVDLSLLTGHTLIEAIRIGATNNYDAFYGGVERFWTTLLPFIVWPPLCGLLSDFFVTMEAPTYSPPVVIFDGFIAIAIFLVVMMPIGSTAPPTSSSASNSGAASAFSSSTTTLRDAAGQKLVLQPTKFRYPRTHSNQYLLCRLALLIPLVLVLGSLWGLADTLTRPFYRRALQCSNFLVGVSTSATFAVAGVFAVSSKSVISGIGRMHLILLAFVFYALKSAGTSFLVGSSSGSRWLLLPFEMMAAFCWLSWIGVTAYGQHLIRRSPNGLSYATGTTIFQTNSPHVVMQYTLNLLYFGGGRALGSAFASIWLSIWPDTFSTWLWLLFVEQSVLENAIESVLDEESAVRVLFRLLAIVALTLGGLFFLLYHSCCLYCFIPRASKYQPPSSSNGSAQSNGRQQRKNGRGETSYMKLKAKSENEVFPLRSKGDHRGSVSGSGGGGQGGGGHYSRGTEPLNTARSMVTLPATSDRELETSVDEYDDDYDHKIASR